MSGAVAGPRWPRPDQVGRRGYRVGPGHRLLDDVPEAEISRCREVIALIEERLDGAVQDSLAESGDTGSPRRPGH